MATRSWWFLWRNRSKKKAENSACLPVGRGRGQGEGEIVGIGKRITAFLTFTNEGLLEQKRDSLSPFASSEIMPLEFLTRLIPLRRPSAWRARVRKVACR